MQKLGDRPAFPGKVVIGHSGEAFVGGLRTQTPIYSEVPGMTYRQWLVGQALLGSAMTIDINEPNVPGPDALADAAVRVADAAITRLEAPPIRPLPPQPVELATNLLDQAIKALEAIKPDGAVETVALDSAKLQAERALHHARKIADPLPF